jgi:hypothetical protein
MYFNRTIYKHKISLFSREDSEAEVLSFSKNCIVAALNRLPRAAENEAVLTFRDIMTYMGDGPSESAGGDSRLKDQITDFNYKDGDLVQMKKMVEMADEVYCQVRGMKYTFM